MDINSRKKNIGLLILRVGIGFMFILHGYPKISGGPENWYSLREKAMTAVGLGFGFTFFGFMAAFSEFCGGILIFLGLGTRYAAALMLITMIIASTLHLTQGDGIMGASHAIESGIFFLALVFIGPGKFSIDDRYCNQKN